MQPRAGPATTPQSQRDSGTQTDTQRRSGKRRYPEREKNKPVPCVITEFSEKSCKFEATSICTYTAVRWLVGLLLH